MSEYQYYEFQTLERPLTQVEKSAIGKLSSRVKLTSTRAIFTYSYSDLPEDPKKLLTQYFDALYYIANWGTQQLMFRFPKDSIDPKAIAPYCIEHCISLSFAGNFAILDWTFSQDEGFEDWIDEEGLLTSLIGLRQEILQQDYRGLYLAWLKGITISESFVALDKNQLESPVPSGLERLTTAQSAFAEIFALDEHLLKAAVQSSPQTLDPSEQSIRQAIAQLSRSECDEFLFQLVRGKSNLSAQLKQLIAASPATNPPQRTILQLLDAAQQEREQAEEHQKQEAKTKRIQELQALAQREEEIWQEVETLLEKPRAKTYEQAINLLLQLRDLADYQRQPPSQFENRLRQIAEKYSKRTALIQRLRQAKLLSKL